MLKLYFAVVRRDFNTLSSLDQRGISENNEGIV
jgi:hypothetical protein